MKAEELAQQNFATAAHLLDLCRLLQGLKKFDVDKEFALAVCSKMEVAGDTAFHHARNESVLCCVKAAMPLPSCLLTDGGMDFLLRQSILVAAAAVESFLWDVLRENALTIIQAKGRKADETLRNITLTIDDYLSLEGYEDKDVRLRQIILKRFERGALYDLDKVSEIAQILGVRDLWKDVGKEIGSSPEDIKAKLMALINRRNQIVHRADRPDEGAPATEIDCHGLRKIGYAWANNHVQLAKSFVTGSAAVIARSMEQMEQIISRRTEQELAQQTLQPAATFTPSLQAVPVALTPETAPVPAPAAPAPQSPAAVKAP